MAIPAAKGISGEALSVKFYVYKGDEVKNHSGY
jgi:hypothetical protein